MQHPTTTSFSLLPPTSPHTPIPVSMPMQMPIQMPMQMPISSQTTSSPSITPPQTVIPATTPTTMTGMSNPKLPGKHSKNGNSTSPVSQPNQRRNIAMATHYMTCCKCGKKRAVPMYVAMVG